MRKMKRAVGRRVLRQNLRSFLAEIAADYGKSIGRRVAGTVVMTEVENDHIDRAFARALEDLRRATIAEGLHPRLVDLLAKFAFEAMWHELERISVAPAMRWGVA